jgi:hypothetical protein
MRTKKKEASSLRLVIQAAAAMVLLFSGVAQALLVRVYYPAGHYLGCGTPAADGSGIWSYDARVSEADCHDARPANPPTPSLYVSANRFEDFNDLATRTLSTFTPEPIRQPNGTFIPIFDATHIESGVQTGVGTTLRLNDWFTLDLGLSAGNGTASRTSNLRTREEVQFQLLGGSIAAKVYPFQGLKRVQPWLSAGVRGLALRPTGGSYTSFQQDLDLPGRSFEPKATADLSSGAGADIRLTDRLGVTLSGEHGFNTGWRAGVAVRFSFPPHRRFPLPDGNPCPYAGCPEDCPNPFGCTELPFPFPYLGAIHSEALDAVLQSVRQAASAPQERARTREDLEEFVQRSGQGFIRARGFGNAGVDAFQAGWERGRVEGGTFATIPGFERLKADQKRYLIEVERLVVEAPEKPVGRPFEDLGRKALEELGATDAQIVLSSASVANGSLDYWRGHLRPWKDAVGGFVGQSITLSDLWKDVKKVLIADVAGAVGGAIGAASTGQDPVGGAISGAVGGSVGEVIEVLF